MGKSFSFRGIGWFVASLLFAAPALAQVATGNVAGSVKDTQAGVIPGATVRLISQTRGTTLDTTTNVNGDFVFVDVTQDTYSVKVTMDGFKTLERHDIPVSAGDRVALGTLTIEVGALSETVLVSGEAPMIQANSGERSFTVSRDSVENLPISGRNFASFVALAPGTAPGGGTRLGGNGNNNYQLDGVSNMDTGSNGQSLNLNPDAIAEVKVVSQGYQAEYGRASGLQISGITKSGSNQLHGSVYDLERRTSWNENTWANVQNGNPKALADQRDWGYTIGGPVGKPGGANKLFFFYSQQFSPRTSGGGAPTLFRVPTALERQGDFSQSLDANGNLVNLIRDASTGLPCTAGDTRGCFQDGGVLGKIPANRLYSLGLNILNLWPLPNTSGLGYNYQVTPPVDKRSSWQPTVRMDYQMSSKLRVSGKYAGQRATVKPTAGSIPGFNDTLNRFPFITQYTSTADLALNSSTVMEGTWGFFRNQLGSPIITPQMNRCNDGLCDIPFLYPNFGVLPPQGYQHILLSAMNVPYLVNNSLLLMPQFTWGNKIPTATTGSGPLAPPSLGYPTFTNLNHTNDVSISVTKLKGSHTMKAGFYLTQSLKMQNIGVAAGANPFQGTINFSNDTNNPLDTGFGFANAALGIFDSYGQQSKIVDGGYIYKNLEWYAQDSWKVNGRLTVDYGLRLTHQQPQYDKFEQASNFFTDKWTSSQAPLLYVAGCPGNVNPCATANRVAVNPLTGVSLGAGSSPAIGTLVPGTGSLTNGLLQNGQGISKYNYVWPGLVVGPRFGAAYDIRGDQHVVLRGSWGLFFDRPDGDSIYGQISNPPTSTSTTVQYGTLQSIGSSGLVTSAPPQLQIFQYKAKIPTAIQWNFGVQMQLPGSMAADVSYVGNHGFNLLQNLRGTQAVMDLNAPDFGAAYLPQNQDPTLAASAVLGGTAVQANQLRPYGGYGSIFYFAPIYHSQFDSIQTSVNRRFRHGLQFGVNYTYSLRFEGNAGITGGGLGLGLRLQHNADGSYSVRSDQAAYEKLNEDMGNRAHVLNASAVWQLPRLSGDSGAVSALGYVVNDWQVSTVFTAGSGAPYDATFTYQSNGAAVNLTGSPSYNGKIVINGDPGSGCSSNQYQQLNASAFSAPVYGSLGLESGRNLFRGCADHTVNLAIARNFPLGGGRQAQFRVDLFNAFNNVIFNTFQSQLQLTSPTNQTVLNPQYNADGTLNQARLLPRNAGFGAATAAQAPRTVQVQLRFQF